MRRVAIAVTLLLAGCAATPAPPGGSTAGITCAGGRITGAGSTAQTAAVNAWIKAYQVACADATIAYASGGSSAGVRAFGAGEVDFAGTDTPLGDADRSRARERCRGEVLHLPLVAGAVAVVHNVAGVRELNLTPATLASIFTHRVTTWNDPAIAKDNPQVALPATPIRTVHRADSSGTTANFTGFLTRAAPERWRLGTGSAWPGEGGLPQRGSYRVATTVARTDGGIGYVEASYARFHDLPSARIGTADGGFQAPDDRATAAAVGAAEVSDDLRLSFRGNDGYPIVSVTYEIVCGSGAPELIRSFLSYAASPAGQDSAGGAPLPESLRHRVVDAINRLG